MKTNNPYLLPASVKPLHYDLELAPDLDKKTFSGTVDIQLQVLEPTAAITLHARTLTISSAVVNEEKITKQTQDKEKETTTFHLAKPLQKGSTRLSLAFQGKLGEDLRGFYQSTYALPDGTKKRLATTQFEPTDARKCFPCFDEPAQKSTFSITLNIPKNLIGISNMPVERETVRGDRKRVTFQKTPVMSTYLLAFLIGEFESISKKTKAGTTVSIWTTPGKKQLGSFALDVGIRCLDFYNDYFGIPYPLPKLDMIAIPDFESGAMENWGAVTYRETALLIDDENSPAANKQNTAYIIAHELAHQWFGNLVTMRWWNDLWLNEGFATWMGWKATDNLFPDWDIWTQFYVNEIDNALSSDSLENSHPIEVDVLNPGEINEVFDDVSYAKGACIIRMLEQYLGAQLFRRGLKNYFTKLMYGNSTTADLWDALGKAANKPVHAMMQSWTQQTGYPVITIKRTKEGYELKQERFFLHGKKADTTLWHIPLAVSDGSTTTVEYFNQRTMTLKTTKDLRFNVELAGFYRINYESDLFAHVNAKAKQKTIPLMERIGLEADTYALVRARYISIETYLDLLEAFKGERDYTLWGDITGNLRQLYSQFHGAHFLPQLQKFSRILYGPLAQHVGWDERPNEKQTEIFLRQVVLVMMGVSGDEATMKEAQRRFAERQRLHPNLRSTVYSLAASQGNKATWNDLVSLYKTASLQEEKMRALAALCWFKQPELIKKTLDFLLSTEVRSQDAFIGLGRSAANPYARDATWAFVKKHWGELVDRYGSGGHAMVRIIEAVASPFNTRGKYKEIETFFKKHSVSNARRAIQQALESMRINIAFKKEQEDKLATWLASRR